MAAPGSLTSRMLVPLGGSDHDAQALAYVLALATPKSEIVLAQVLPRSRARNDPGGQLQGMVGTVPEIALAAEEDALRRRVHVWGLPTDRTRIALRIGDPAECLLEIASGEGCTLVVLTHPGHGALGWWRFGSVAGQLARSAPIPTLIHRPNRHSPQPGNAATVQRLVVPLDGSPRAEHALPVAQALAHQLEVSVQLVRVVPPPDLPDVVAVGTGTAGTPPPPPAIGQRSTRTSATDAAVRYLATIGDVALGGVETRIDVRMGKVVPRLLEVLEPTDLVVLSSRRRSGVGRWLLGSVGDKLLRHAAAPVCLVPGVIS
jgi:nucleotide-binding universal stress UspA family protein